MVRTGIDDLAINQILHPLNLRNSKRVILGTRLISERHILRSNLHCVIELADLNIAVVQGVVTTVVLDANESFAQIPVRVRAVEVIDEHVIEVDLDVIADYLDVARVPLASGIDGLIPCLLIGGLERVDR